jgi:hypothetical protein
MAKSSKSAPVSVVYIVTESGAVFAGKSGNSLQRLDPSLPTRKAVPAEEYKGSWVAHGQARGNLRVLSVGALADLGKPFSHEIALATVKPFCHSATPAGRIKVLLAAGHIAIAK